VKPDTCRVVVMQESNLRVRSRVSKRSEVLERAENLLKSGSFSKMDEAHFHSLMRLHDALPEDKAETRGYHDAAELRTRAAERGNVDAVDEAFRAYLRKGEKRTALNVATGSQGGYLVPAAWQANYQQRLVSSSGILKAGATIVNSDNAYGRPWLHFFSDDTSNEAVVLAENAQFASTPTPVASVTTPTVQKFSTAALASAETASDIAFDLDGYLQSLFAVRVARAFNHVASVDSTYGVVNQFNVGATSASSSVPSLVELSAMQDPSVINPAYLEADSEPCYMVSPTMRTRLVQQVDANGRRLYPEIAKGELLGFPLVSNVDMPSAASSVAVTFGSVKRAVLVQNVRPILLRSVEKFAEYNQIFFAFHHRLGVKVTDANAITALALHS